MNRTPLGGRIALVLGSVLFGLIVLELGCRIARGPEWLVQWPNIILQDRERTQNDVKGRTVHDPRLGFVGRPGFSYGGLHYDARGLRMTPAPEGTALTGPPILVLGDSYAHGDEVADNETWAARLESLTGRVVVNAAMSGYGIDQMVLRAELLVPEIKPAAIVLSFIADDVRRSEMKRLWGAEKPYFEMVDGALVLRNVPVLLPPDPADTLSIWQRLFGRSMLVDTVLRHQGWQYEWAIDHVRVLSEAQGERQLCPLLRRLASLGVPTLVVAEYDSYLWMDADYAPVVRRVTGLVLSCAKEAGLATLDLFQPIDEAVRAQGLHTVYLQAHPSPVGTAIAARRIAEALERNKMLAPQ
jgi:hypothetical protein